MNMGIGDAFDLGWKLAAVVNQQAGTGLLTCYEQERKPVALQNVTHSGVHYEVHLKLKDIFAGCDPRLMDGDSEERKELRRRVHEHYQKNDGENKDFGIEMGYRYTSDVIFRQEADGEEPARTARNYTPSTWPGSRAPHVFLSDGEAIFDLFGANWALLVFTKEEVGQKLLMAAAERSSVPTTQVNLAHEEHAKKSYERQLVLIRPDHHVAWRSDILDSSDIAQQVLRTVTGRANTKVDAVGIDEAAKGHSFGATGKQVTQVDDFVLEKMGAFQQ